MSRLSYVTSSCILKRGSGDRWNAGGLHFTFSCSTVTGVHGYS